MMLFELNQRDFIKAFLIRMDYCHTLGLRNGNGSILSFVRMNVIPDTGKHKRSLLLICSLFTIYVMAWEI